MALTAEIQMWLTFAVIGTTIIAYSVERFPIELTALGSLIVLMLIFVGMPVAEPQSADLVSLDELLAGFANPALLTVLSLLVIGQGLFQTDALDAPAQLITKIGKKSRYLAFLGVYVAAAVNSAFINNTPVVVMFLPIMTVVAANLRLSSSKVLMPLSFVSILGGMTTIIGSSTNLLVAEAARKEGVLDLKFFDFTGIGVIVASIGGVYALFIMPRILKKRESMTDQMSQTTGKQFIAQLPITYGDVLEGEKAVAGMFPSLKGMTVRLVQRGETPHLPPFDNVTLKAGDTVVVAATRQALLAALKGGHNVVGDGVEDDGQTDVSPDFTLAEVIVPPASRMIGQTIEQAGIRSKTNCMALGVQRRSRMPRKAMSSIRLEPGDVLLIGGRRHDVEAMRLSKDLLLIELSTTEVPRRRYAPRALGIFLLTALASATGLLPIATAAIGGAFLMIISHCLNLRQAIRALDSRIFMLVGASLASAVALQKTGGAHFIASGVVDAMAGQPAPILLSGLFLLVAILTNILSNNATAVLFAPIAISIANQTGLPVEPFVVCVIIAANCSFATPIGYQTNLLVMGPGHYRFMDFLVAGIPLMLIIWVSFSLIAPWYYGISF